jgi:acyl dehydratase
MAPSAHHRRPPNRFIAAISFSLTLLFNSLCHYVLTSATCPALRQASSALGFLAVDTSRKAGYDALSAWRSRDMAKEGESTSELTVVAYNRAAVGNPNPVHDPEFARSVGFRGGLVPGVDVFAYLVRAPVDAWGSRWLGEGGLEARFEAVNGSGTFCATAEAERRIAEPPPDPERWPERSLPAVLLAATPEALAANPVLGSLRVTVTAEEARQQLADVREPSGQYARKRIVHPGHLLRFADSILAANVLLPPWMHVSSRARFFNVVHWGEQLSVRATRGELFEKKGHRFVQLDVLVTGPRGPVLRVEPYTAIYAPAWTNRMGHE